MQIDLQLRLLSFIIIQGLPLKMSAFAFKIGFNPESVKKHRATRKRGSLSHPCDFVKMIMQNSMNASLNHMKQRISIIDDFMVTIMRYDQLRKLLIRHTE